MENGVVRAALNTAIFYERPCALFWSILGSHDPIFDTSFEGILSSTRALLARSRFWLARDICADPRAQEGDINSIVLALKVSRITGLPGILWILHVESTGLYVGPVERAQMCRDPLLICSTVPSGMSSLCGGLFWALPKT